MMVFITGASGGLGRAMAVDCAKRGYDLFLTDINPESLAQLKRGILRRYKVRVKTWACDLTDAGDVEAMFRAADEQNDSFDMLLNIAGIDFEGGFMDRDCTKILDIVYLNIAATLRITHKVLERRATGRRFYLMFVSSLASLYPIPLKATYAASKRFLLDFSYAIREELTQENVFVLALCPGGLVTTKEAVSGILAQGFWGNATTNRLETVAHSTISRVLRGRKIYIPGAVNRAFSILGQLLPRHLIARLLHNRWNTAQKQWLHSHNETAL
ncbi:MAG: SDR family NAD(P)-dependent oxidoreductase [Christensenellales bacterium]